MDDYTVACNFADFFANKVRNISNSIAATSSTDMGDKTVKQYLHLNCVKEVGLSNMRSFQPLTISDLKDVMDEMNSKTCDLDLFPTHLVLRCLDVLWLPLLHIVNLSLATGVVPHTLKNACVVPLLKCQSLDSDVMGNYRPVSNLSYVSKIIEKCVYR